MMKWLTLIEEWKPLSCGRQAICACWTLAWTLFSSLGVLEWVWPNLLIKFVKSCAQWKYQRNPYSHLLLSERGTEDNHLESPQSFWMRTAYLAKCSAKCYRFIQDIHFICHKCYGKMFVALPIAGNSFVKIATTAQRSRISYKFKNSGDKVERF